MTIQTNFASDDLDEKLVPSLTLSDYQLNEVALVPSNRSASRSVSSSDILKLQAVENLTLADVRRRQFGRPLGSTARSVRGSYPGRIQPKISFRPVFYNLIISISC